jgi:hypothetical protein
MPKVDPKPDIEPQSTQRLEGTERNPNLHPTLCSLWPLWLVLCRFSGSIGMDGAAHHDRLALNVKESGRQSRPD